MLQYSLTGDHIDAEEALRLGLVNQVVPAHELIDTCFGIVERIALVPPETVKLNLTTAVLGLEMMGFRDAMLMDGQLSTPAHVMLREELRRPLDETRKNEGTRAYLQMRDGPFQPEPFGPRSRKSDEEKGRVGNGRRGDKGTTGAVRGRHSAISQKQVGGFPAFS